MAIEIEDKLLTITEVAQRLRVDTTTIKRWIKAGAMEAIELPRYGTWTQYRVKQCVLDRILAPEEAK